MKVKPLWWGKSEGADANQEWHIAGIVDTYVISKDGGDWRVSAGNKSLGGFPSLEAAKAACKADWQQRATDLLARITVPSDEYGQGYRDGIEAAAKVAESIGGNCASASSNLHLQGEKTASHLSSYATTIVEIVAGTIRKLGEKP